MWDNLCQKSSLEEYIKSHRRIGSLAANSINPDEGLVIHVFLQNEKLRLLKFIRNKDCNTLKKTYREAQNAKQKAKFINP